MTDLFGDIVQKKKKKGNPFHNHIGKFTDKQTALLEKEKKRANVAENKYEYIMSAYNSLGRQYSKLLREYEELKKSTACGQ